MKTYQFNTTLKCEGCVAKIKPFLDGDDKIKNWNVDLSKSPKVLSVESESISAEEVKDLLAKAGYKGEEI